MDRQDVENIAKVQVREYFDHYLDHTLPRQLKTIFEAHNQDAEAHQVLIGPLMKVRKRAQRLIWMVLGGAAVVGVVGTLIVEHLSAVVQIFSK